MAVATTATTSAAIVARRTVRLRAEIAEFVGELGVEAVFEADLDDVGVAAGVRIRLRAAFGALASRCTLTALTAALAQARTARLEILDVMNACISQSRDEVAETAPKITTIHIPLDKVGEVIGPKGKVINTIQQETGADIGVDDDGAQGIVTIGAVEAWRMEEAKAAILAIVDPPKAEIDAVYTGRVVNTTKFGAFVNILPGRDGLVHISKLGGGKRINAV